MSSNSCWSVSTACAVTVFVAVMLGGTIPLPLYALWAPRFGFGPLTVTVIFSSYAVGVAGVLLVAGSLTERLGTRTSLAVALFTAAGSTLVFIRAEDVLLLVVARALSGIATGLASVAGTTAVSEQIADPRRAAALATSANLGGLASGGVLAGFAAEHLTAPTTTVFGIYLTLLVATAAALIAVPGRSIPAERLRLTLPALPADPTARSEFLRGAIAVGASFGLNGFFSSLAPEFLHRELGVDGLALDALGGSVASLAALLAQILVPAARQTRRTGGAAMIGGALLLAIAIAQR